MSQPGDYISALSSYHPDVDLNSVFGTQAQDAANTGMSVSDFVGKYLNDPGISQAYVKKYTSFAQPQLDQFNTQIGLAQNQGNILNQQYQSGVNQTNNQVDNSVYGIRQNQLDQNQSLFNQADAAGLSRSGVTNAAQGRIAANTTQNLSYTEAQRANSLAQLALQNQEGQTTVAGNIANLQSQVGSTQSNIQQQAQQDAYNNSQNFYSRQQDALKTLQSGVNYSLLANSPAYASILSNVLQHSGLGYASPEDLMGAAKQVSGSATATTSSTPSAPTVTTPTPVTPALPVQNAPQYKVGSVNPNSQLGSYLIGYFKKPSSAWAGHDSSDISFLQNKFGISPDVASYYYYQLRKSVAGQ